MQLSSIVKFPIFIRLHAVNFMNNIFKRLYMFLNSALVKRKCDLIVLNMHLWWAQILKIKKKKI